MRTAPLTALRTAAAALTAMAAAFALTSCSSTAQDAKPGGTSSSGAVTVTAANGRVTLPAPARRIVSLSPTATEDLFAVGAGHQVVAVDDQSDYPANAPRTKLSGFTPNVEAIAGYNPGLVVVSDDIGGIVASLTKLHIPVLREPAAKSLDDVYAQLRTLGAATGHRSQADTVVSGMQSKITAALAKRPAKPATYYYELDPTHYSATSDTFIGRIFARFGMVNIADKADAQHSGYPKLSDEYVVQSAPDFVFLADTRCCGQSASTVAARPAWNRIPAVGDHRVIALDDDIASRWGPRVADLVRTISDAVNR